jgi:hypothetical protein
MPTIRLDGGETPEGITGHQFSLFEMLADLFDSDLASAAARIDMAHHSCCHFARGIVNDFRIN